MEREYQKPEVEVVSLVTEEITYEVELITDNPGGSTSTTVSPFG